MAPLLSRKNIKTRPFLLRIESFNLDITRSANGMRTINQDVTAKHKEMLDKLISREYLVNIETTDGYFFNQAVDFHFMEGHVELIR